VLLYPHPLFPLENVLSWNAIESCLSGTAATGKIGRKEEALSHRVGLRPRPGKFCEWWMREAACKWSEDNLGKASNAPWATARVRSSVEFCVCPCCSTGLGEQGKGERLRVGNLGWRMERRGSGTSLLSYFHFYDRDHTGSYKVLRARVDERRAGSPPPDWGRKGRLQRGEERGSRRMER